MQPNKAERILYELLERLADARELVDVNIAEGIALQEIEKLDTR